MMRFLKYGLILLVLIGIAAAITRPGPAEFDAMLERAIRDRVANTDIGADADLGPTIALAACKLRPSDCVALVRGSMDVAFDEGIFVTRARVKGLNRETRCLGVFGRFFCERPVAG